MNSFNEVHEGKCFRERPSSEQSQGDVLRDRCLSKKGRVVVKLSKSRRVFSGFGAWFRQCECFQEKEDGECFRGHQTLNRSKARPIGIDALSKRRKYGKFFEAQEFFKGS